MGISGTMNHLKQLRCGAFEDAVLQFADEGLVFSSESFVVGQKKKATLMKEKAASNSEFR